MAAVSGEWPEMTLPDAEADRLRDAYRDARVILEYGSGGSTVAAAGEPGKLIFSVESDREWALSLQQRFDQSDLPSEVIIQHVDIGPTGRWGRPKDESGWRYFHRYPTSIWTEAYFRQPDVILVDGRLRPACFVNACLRTTKPLTVLFDDYVERPMYHVVESLVKPAEIVGRMAVFHVTPHEWPSWTEDLFLELCTRVSVEGDTVDYSQIPAFPFIDPTAAKSAS